ncbi:hypothetical protein AAG570_011697 [Ranatra chinensis]|uniref:Sushi domain-containing protein n=1 Tax=Ranatra chinensis TaxID=642074 RepID=A0ABD0YH28_9HEMI
MDPGRRFATQIKGTATWNGRATSSTWNSGMGGQIERPMKDGSGEGWSDPGDAGSVPSCSLLAIQPPNTGKLARRSPPGLFFFTINHSLFAWDYRTRCRLSVPPCDGAAGPRATPGPPWARGGYAAAPIPRATRRSQNKCTLPKLENGVVRLRSRGRIIRFSCRDGYTIYGEKYAACNRGRWDVPMPACITKKSWRFTSSPEQDSSTRSPPDETTRAISTATASTSGTSFKTAHNPLASSPRTMTPSSASAGTRSKPAATTSGSATARPTPIHVAEVSDFEGLCYALEALVRSERFTCRYPHDIVIAPSTPDGYRAVIRYLAGNNFSYHTYQLQSDRSYRVVMKGLNHRAPVGEDSD